MSRIRKLHTITPENFRRKSIVAPTLTVAALLVLTGLAFMPARSGKLPVRTVNRQNPNLTIATNVSAARNLSLQPEAFNLARRLGQRFSPRKRQLSTLIGTLTIGSEQKLVTTIRKQTRDGEQVEIYLAGSPVLTWDANQGVMAAGARANPTDRAVIEGLVFDSPDQFVLAQLRGATYYTLGRNVRPADAGQNYTGPLWNIVRVNDPESDETRRPQSGWRLYYLNVTTDLIDRIESDVQGQQIIAEIPRWTEINGEKIPAQINWTRQGRIIMQFTLTSFSHAEL